MFWRRYAPLYRDVHGHCGMVLSIGLTVDFIMQWSGSPAQRLWLPRGTGRELGAPYHGQLEGTTADRQDAWCWRFEEQVPTKVRVPDKNRTYSRLRDLVLALKREGARRGVPDLKVAALTVAHIDAYSGRVPFARAHSEAWTRWGKSSDPVLDSADYFDGSALLYPDPTPRGGLPEGGREGLPVHSAFGAQWGAVSRFLALDGLMLRNSFGFLFGPTDRLFDNEAEQISARAETGQLMAFVASLPDSMHPRLVQLGGMSRTASPSRQDKRLQARLISKSGASGVPKREFRTVPNEPAH